MRTWIDVEFNDYHGALISLALVTESGREWYGVRFCDDPSEWVRENVMPVLGREPQRDSVLRVSLEDFLWSLDSVHIIADWPGDIAHFCHFLEYAPGRRFGPDTMTFEVRRDLASTSATSAIPHNALEDARALRRSHMALQEPSSKTTIADRAQALILHHGGLRAAATALDLSPSYLSRLASGVKSNPEEGTLKALGLRRVVSYESTVL